MFIFKLPNSVSIMKFDSPINQSSIIKVIGVGGGGSNAVTHMYKQGIRGVDFILANTDSQALDISDVPVKLQLGANLTEGMGAGSIPEIGRQAAIESSEDIRNLLQVNTKMVFITAGMGGGTGTGAAPVIASIAKELGILTVGIVTIPFAFEGRKRRQQADHGIGEMRKYVDTLLIICNDKLRELHGDLKLSDAFGRADNILTIAARGIAEIITVTGYINVDFNDVNTVMRDSGAAIMGAGIAEGENRAHRAVEMALTSPLLNDSNIDGAKNVLLYIASGLQEVSMDEVTEITDFIQDEAGTTAEIIWGNGIDESLGNNIGVTIIATGFKATSPNGISVTTEPDTQKVIIPLDREPEPIKKPIEKEDFKIYTLEDKLPEKNPEIKKEPIIYKEPQQVKENNDDFKLEIRPVQNNLETEKKDVPVLNSIEEKHINENFPITKEKTLDNQTDDEREMYQKSLDRQRRLRELSVKLKTPGGLAEIENEPAYKRRNVELSNVNPSSESEISRFSLGEDEEKKTELKNNTFLHDNVD
jgi:cell division protein FtsZ